MHQVLPANVADDRKMLKIKWTLGWLCYFIFFASVRLPSRRPEQLGPPKTLPWPPFWPCGPLWRVFAQPWKLALSPFLVVHSCFRRTNFPSKHHIVDNQLRFSKYGKRQVWPPSPNWRLTTCRPTTTSRLFRLSIPSSLTNSCKP